MKKSSLNTHHKTSFLKTVERTLDVLELLSKKRSIGITKLSRIKKIGLSTSHRILSTLERKGYAVQSPDTGKYSLGHMIYKLSTSFLDLMTPVKYVQPYLDKLCKQTGENSAFCAVTPWKDRTIILAEVMSDKAVISRPFLFQHIPLHVCPCGKLFLLTLPDDRIKEELSKNVLKKFTKYTPISFPMLKKQLEKFRELGYAISQNEFEIGLTAMGSSLFNCKDDFIGAIVLFGPSIRLDTKNIKRFGKLLLKFSSQLNLEFKSKHVL